jgi:hypothetical protein
MKLFKLIANEAQQYDQPEPTPKLAPILIGFIIALLAFIAFQVVAIALLVPVNIGYVL